MKRVLRYLWRALAGLGLLAAILLAAYVFILPGYVESAVRTALREAGFTQAKFDFGGVSTGRLHLANLSLADEPRLDADAVDVTYTLGMLWDGRVDTVTLTGVVWDVAWRDGRLDLGAIEQLQAQDDAAGGAALPFERLVLRSSQFRVAVGGRKWHVPVDGEIVQTEPGRLSARGGRAGRTRRHDPAGRCGGGQGEGGW